MNQTIANSIPFENRVLRNTFTLLALTFLFSAIMAGISLALAVPFLGPWVTLGVYIVLIVALMFNRNSPWAILLCFAITGWLGFTLGPVLGAVAAIDSSIIVNSFVMATIALLGLSAYAINSRRDFSFMGGFLTVGILIAFVAGIAAIFFELPMLSLVVSAAFVLLSSGMILWQVSDIVNGGETNYVMAALSLYISFFNIFVSLMNIFGYNTD
jgi:modulator of FtsH protease